MREFGERKESEKLLYLVYNVKNKIKKENMLFVSVMFLYILVATCVFI